MADERDPSVIVEPGALPDAPMPPPPEREAPPQLEPGFVGGGRASGVMGWGPEAQPRPAIADDLESAPSDFWAQMDDAFSRDTITADDYVGTQRQRVHDFENPLLQAQRDQRAAEAEAQPLRPEDVATLSLPEGGTPEVSMSISRTGTPESAAPPPEPPSTAQQISQALHGIGLQGLRPVEPATTIVDAMYAGDPAKEKNPVYITARRLAMFTDLGLNTLNVAATGVGDIANLIFAPITLGLREAGFSEEEVQQFVQGTRFLPELVAGMELGLPPGTLAGKLGIIGNLTGATKEVKTLVREVAGLGRQLRINPSLLADTKVVNDAGAPVRVYHGTTTAYPEMDVGKADKQALYGPGLYFTENPRIASGYAEGASRTPQIAPNVRPAYLDIQRPFDIEAVPSPDELTDIGRAAAAMGYEDLGRFFTEHANWVRQQGDDSRRITTPTFGTIEIAENGNQWVYQMLVEQLSGNDLASVRTAGVPITGKVAAPKAVANQILQAAGYDGITHMGGAITGTDPHRVWIAFHPEQVVNPFELETRPTLAQIIENEIGGVRGPKVPPNTRSMARLFKLGVEKGGALWYHEFGDTLRRLYPGNTPEGVEQADAAAGVIAALSPLRKAQAYTEKGTFIENSNLEAFRQVWELYEKEGYAAVEKAIGPNRQIGMMKSQRENVLRALRGEQIGGADALKIQSFKQALLGDKHAVVLDSWMKRIFYPEHKAPVWKKDIDPETLEETFALDAKGERIPVYETNKKGEIVRDKLTGQPVQKMEHIGAFSPAQYRATADIIRNFAKKMSTPERPVFPSDVQAALWVAKKFLDEGEAGLLGSKPFKDTLREVFEHAGYDLRAFDEAGKGQLGVHFALAHALLGAAAGGTQGETTEEKVRNAFIGAGLGAIISPATLKLGTKAVGLLRGKISPELRSPAVQATVGTAPGAPSVVPHNPTTFARQYEDAVITARRGGPREHEMVQQEAQALIDSGQVSMETVQAIMPGTTLDDAHAVAVVKTMADSGMRVKALAQRAMQTGNPADVQAVLQQFYLHSQIDPKRIGVVTEAGRTLSAMNDPTSGLRDFLVQFEQLAREGGLDPQTVVKAISEFQDPEQLAILARQATKPGFWGAFKEYYVNGLLWNPKTWAANTIGNTATTLWAIPERQVAAWLGAFRSGDEGVVQGEAWAMMHGITASVGDAWTLAWKAFREGESQFIPAMGGAADKMELQYPRAISADTFDKTGLTGQAIDWLGNLVRFPSRILAGTDDFFKVINHRAELHALALRHATQAVAGSGLTGKAYAEAVSRRMAQIIADPPMSVKRAADEFALYQTFATELGETGQKIQALAQTPAGKIVLPFVRTPINITKYATDRTPLGLFRKSLRADLNGTDLAKRDLARAKLAMGSATMAVAGIAAWNGVITGAGPSDRKMQAQLRAQGWMPYSIKIGGTYVQYARTEPIGMVLGLAADWAEAVANAEGDDALERFADGAEDAVFALAKNLSSRTFVKGLAETMSAIADPERSSTVRTSSLIVSALPASGMLRAIESVMDPELAEATTTMERVRAQIPGLSRGLPPRRDLWGNPVFMTGVYGPIAITDMKDDPVLKEIVATQANVPELPKHVEERIALTAAERDEWAIARGSMKIDGETLKQALSGLITSRDYKEHYSEERKAWEIELKIREYTDAALADLKEKHEDIQLSIDAAREERFEKREAAPTGPRRETPLLRSLTR